MKHRIAYFKSPAHFSDTYLDNTSPLLKSEYTALIATEGEFKDSAEQVHIFTPEKLFTIESHTNRAIDSGTVIPVCADHKKNVDNTIGSIGGRAFTKVITEDDLPNKKSTDLVGKLGLFLSGVKVAATKGIESLRSGIKSVSMGLNLDPNENRIMELSLVPIPAIPNMGLFSRKLKRKSANFEGGSPTGMNPVTWEQLDSKDSSIEDLKLKYDELTEKLWELLQTAYNDDGVDIDSPEVLLQLIYSQLNGFSIRIIDLLGLTSLMNNAANVQDPNAPPTPNANPQGLNDVAEGGRTIDQSRSAAQAVYRRGGKNANFSSYTRKR